MIRRTAHAGHKNNSDDITITSSFATFYINPPHPLFAQPYSSVPAKWSTPRTSDWASFNFGGPAIGSFLEGPCFDGVGNLYVVDVPFGRIFRISTDKTWALLAKYDGCPNGLKCTPDGRIIVADNRLRLVEIGSDTGRVTVLVYFTDQGQSGLQEQSGSVYRWNQISGATERVLSNMPSPNGLVLAADGSRLFFAVTRSNAIWRAPFVPDGGVSKVGVFLNLSGGGGPDGVAVDAEGGLIVAQPGIAACQLIGFHHLV
ncbi:Six-bladed beta-propeller, TolB-like protein [Niveomyces insectorum RCEF 264]|uniref:Six-bladed beta-propeller, TolB-like protein n=1 Tax=Niveomyces insectorum RCEF 264 TaxID=1081102 RepID=A0A167PJS9_9HYPO|nr:Six-bladed beta-propeller, TolB-like protein [Niveomyces insectorum RCEF 264]